MNATVLRWMVVLAFSLVACKEKLCEQGDESCEVGDGKCVVGYDGDCSRGQVCYAGEGAPKSKQGTCAGGQFDADGKLIATVTPEGLAGLSRTNGQYRDCFFGCPMEAPLPPTWLGKGPATLTVSVHGPNAETERLKIAVRDVEHPICVRNGSTPGGQPLWECSLSEELVGINTTKSLKLQLWTENTQGFPWIGSAFVDTRPLQLDLEVSIEEGFLKLGAQKMPVDIERTYFGAHLTEVEYLSIEAIRNGNTLQLIQQPISCSYDAYWEEPAPSCYVSVPFSVEQHGPLPLTIRAIVNAKDKAGNEVSNAELTALLTP
jgi:hypothetical protein